MTPTGCRRPPLGLSRSGIEERLDGWGEQFGELVGVQQAQAGRLHPVPHETGSHDERGDRLDVYAARWRQPERRP